MAKQAIVSPACPKCEKVSVIMVPVGQYLAWKGGELIQNVFPDWSPDECEVLKTGIHPECWEAMFGGMDD